MRSVMRRARLLAAPAIVLTALAVAPPASAGLTDLLSAGSCGPRDALDGDIEKDGVTLPFTFCDDGVPAQGGRTPNVGAVKAVAVPAAYTGAGQPTKDPVAALAVPGNSGGDVALDVDVSLPDPAKHPMPADGYPVMFMMHGCCAGNKTSWEAPRIDGGGTENWHYNNAWFASRGYVVVNYTARGFVSANQQGSTGETQLDSSKFEINDYQHMAGQLADLPDIDPETPGDQRIDPSKVVPTGGSYGGGFTWMALTDPTWKSPAGKDMKVVAAAAKYGWTNLVESLVPRGDDLRDKLPETDPAKVKARLSTEFGFPKRTINNALYLSGKIGFPNNGSRTTFAPDIDEAQTCLSSTDPYEQNPLCANVRNTSLPRFIDERSAYFQQAFFDGLGAGTIDPVPVFSAGTTTDKLFPAAEHRRMVERLKQVRPGYPVQEYYGDYNHFVQNKRKEWSDLCGDDHHVCRYEDYPGGDLNAQPPNLVREPGVTTRLNRFLDHYVRPPGNPGEPAPDFDVTASLQICPDNASTASPLDEPGERFTAATFDALSPGELTVSATGPQATTNNAEPNPHAARADPIANTASNGSRCPVESAPGGATTAGPGVATYDSDVLSAPATMVGQTRLDVAHTGAGAGLQLNARLYDLYPDGRQVLVDRAVRRLSSATGPSIIDLHGAAWRFPAGHRIRLELAQDDDPYVKSSNQPGSLVIAGVKLGIPTREASAAVGGEVPPGASGPPGPGTSPGPSGPPTPGGSAGRRSQLPVGFGRMRRTIRVRGGVFHVRCRARGSGRRPCSVKVRRPRKGRRARTIGSGRATIRPGGRSILVKVRLGRSGRRALVRAGRRGLRVRLDMRARESSGRRRQGVARRSFVLRATRP